MEKMNGLDSLAERCVWARKRIGLSQDEAAVRAGVSKGVIANVEVGRNKTIRNLTEVAHVLAVNPRWLATGEGPAVDEEGMPPVGGVSGSVASEAEIRMILSWLSSWRNADDVTRSMIESVFAVAGRVEQPNRLQA